DRSSAVTPVAVDAAARLVERFFAARLVERFSAARRVAVDAAAPRSRLVFPPPWPGVAHSARMPLADPVRRNVSPPRPPGLAHPAAWGPPAPAATRRVRGRRHANRHAKRLRQAETVMWMSQFASPRHGRAPLGGQTVTRRSARLA